MKKKQVLVTGGSGKLGRYVVEELRRRYRVVVFDKISPQNKGVGFIRGDILKADAVERACRGMDAAVHLAGLVRADTPEKILKVNVLGTLHLLDGCCRNGVKRVVFASSISCLGFVYRKKPLAPQYLPIDENHPARPQDAYGLSKLLGELICRAYTARYAIETVCLRPPWIWFPGEAGVYEPFVKIHEAWPCLLWAYQDARDAARAFSLAISARGVKHERLFIASKDNGTRYPTLELIARYYPALKKLQRDKLAGKASLINIDKARSVLKYRPRYTWRDILAQEFISGRS